MTSGKMYWDTSFLFQIVEKEMFAAWLKLLLLNKLRELVSDTVLYQPTQKTMEGQRNCTEEMIILTSGIAKFWNLDTNSEKKEREGRVIPSDDKPRPKDWQVPLLCYPRQRLDRKGLKGWGLCSKPSWDICKNALKDYEGKERHPMRKSDLPSGLRSIKLLSSLGISCKVGRFNSLSSEDPVQSRTIPFNKRHRRPLFI